MQDSGSQSLFRAYWSQQKSRFDKAGLWPILDYPRLNDEVSKFIEYCSHILTTSTESRTPVAVIIREKLNEYIGMLAEELTKVQLAQFVVLNLADKRLSPQVVFSLARSLKGRQRIIDLAEAELGRILEARDYGNFCVAIVETVLNRACVELSKCDIEIRTKAYLELLKSRGPNMLIFSLPILSSLHKLSLVLSVIMSPNLEILLSCRVQELSDKIVQEDNKTRLERKKKIDVTAIFKERPTEVDEKEEVEIINCTKVWENELKRLKERQITKEEKFNRQQTISSINANKPPPVNIKDVISNRLLDEVASNLPHQPKPASTSPKSKSDRTIPLSTTSNNRSPAVSSLWRKDKKGEDFLIKLKSIHGGLASLETSTRDVISGNNHPDQKSVQFVAYPKAVPDEIDEEDLNDIEIELNSEEESLKSFGDNKYFIELKLMRIGLMSMCYSVKDFILVVIHALFCNFYFYSFTPHSQAIITNTGLPSYTVGWIYAITPVCAILLSPLFTFIAKKQFRKSYVLSLLLLTLSAGFTIWALEARHMFQLIVSRALLGLGSARILVSKFVAKHIEVEFRVGVNRGILAAMSLMMGFGPGVVALIFQSQLWSNSDPSAMWRLGSVSVGMIIVFFIILLLFIFMFRDVPKVVERKAYDYEPMHRGSDATLIKNNNILHTSSPEKSRESISQTKAKWFYRRLIFSSLGLFTSKAIQDMVVLNMSFYFEERRGMTASWAGFIILCYSVFCAICVAASFNLQKSIQDKIYLLIVLILLPMTLVLPLIGAQLNIDRWWLVYPSFLALPLAIMMECGFSSLLTKIQSIGSVTFLSEGSHLSLMEQLGRAAGLSLVSLELLKLFPKIPLDWVISLGVSLFLLLFLLLGWKGFTMGGFHKFEYQ